MPHTSFARRGAIHTVLVLALCLAVHTGTRAQSAAPPAAPITDEANHIAGAFLSIVVGDPNVARNALAWIDGSVPLYSDSLIP